jgi:hypothetical protein
MFADHVAVWWSDWRSTAGPGLSEREHSRRYACLAAARMIGDAAPLINCSIKFKKLPPSNARGIQTDYRLEAPARLARAAMFPKETRKQRTIVNRKRPSSQKP